MTGRKPEKKPFGRVGPPKGYPKAQSAYADPENWRYPLHTPWHAKAARRYFDDWSNRGKYTEEERAYIDWRIDEALKKFDKLSKSAARSKRPAPRLAPGKKIEQLSLRELLQLFVSQTRLGRAAEIPDSLVFIDEATADRFSGKVKDYTVRIEIKERTILHDCEDWRKNMESKAMCKHLAKFLLTIDSRRATDLLREVLRNKEEWKFTAP